MIFRKAITLNLLLFLFVLVLINLAGSALAQESENKTPTEGITLWPTFQTITVQSGEVKRIEFSVRNDTENSAKIDVSFRNLIIDSNPLEGINLSESGDESPAAWLKSRYTGPVKLDVGETKTVIVDLRVPEDVEYKGYYPVILVHIIGDQVEKSVSTEAILSSLVYLSVADVKGETAEREAKIMEFSPSSRFSFSPKMNFNAAVQNEGTVHLRSRGSITVYDPSGTRQVNSSTFNDKFIFLLPQQVLRENISWKDITYSRIFPPVGQYRAVFELEVEDSPVQILSEESTFFVLPLQYIGASIIIIEILIGLGYMFIRAIRHRRTII